MARTNWATLHRETEAEVDGERGLGEVRSSATSDMPATKAQTWITTFTLEQKRIPG